MVKLFFNLKLLHFFYQNVKSGWPVPPYCFYRYIWCAVCIPYMGYTVDFMPFVVLHCWKRKRK